MARRTSLSRRASEKAGRRAEFWAGLYLIFKGYRILAHRFRASTGEIDLIAMGPPWRKKSIVFIEVKRRRRAEHAIDPVSARSEARIIATAEVWLSARPHLTNAGYGAEFDVIVLTGRFKLRHMKNAFRGW